MYLESRIDKLYSMTEQLMSLAIMGKRLGLEDKAENLARVNFLLEQQLKDLGKTIGYEPDKIKEVDVTKNVERAEKTLEFIVTAYDDIIQEIKNSLTANVVPVIMNSEPVGSVTTETTAGNSMTEQTPVVGQNKPEKEDDEPIDFGFTEQNNECVQVQEDNNFEEADFDALANFFG